MMRKIQKNKIDWFLVIMPTSLVVLLGGLLYYYPFKSKEILNTLRKFLNNDCDFIYILVGLLFFGSTIVVAFSKIGMIKIGKHEDKPAFSNLRWGMLVFTSTISADIIFYSLAEWMMYVKEPFLRQKGNLLEWSLTYSLFHWGPIAWSFYIMLAVCFAYMLYVNNSGRQKFSEACRPLLKTHTDGLIGRLIDLVAIIALISGTATTFSMSLPLLTHTINGLFNIPNTRLVSILLMISVVCIYLGASVIGMKAISIISEFCYLLFVALLLYVLVCSASAGPILDMGIQSVGNLVQNFVGMSTETQTHGFTQNWTIYYWSYWIVWSVATPFFIASISKGRTIRDIILRGYLWGLGGTFSAFIILSGFGITMQRNGHINVISMLSHNHSYYDIVIRMLETLPQYRIVLILLSLTMIGLYSTVFESITMVISKYSYRYLDIGVEPGKNIKSFWAIIFIILPIVLLLNESSIHNIQSIAIIAAFPTMLVMVIILLSFLKESREQIYKKKKF